MQRFSHRYFMTIAEMLSAEHAKAPMDGVVIAPYSHPHEHLADLLLRHDWLLRRHLARGRARTPDDLLGFAAISAEEVQRLLDGSATSDGAVTDLALIDLALEQLERHIDARAVQSRLHGVPLPVIELAKRFALTSREVDLLLACLAVELDSRYERVYGYLHDDMTRRLASPGLAIDLHCDDVDARLGARALLNAQAPLRYFRLLDVLEPGSARPWHSRPMHIDERIVSFLVGEQASDARIVRFMAPLDAGMELPGHADDADMATGQIAHWAATVQAESRARPLIYLQGPRHADADGHVRRIAAKLNVTVITVDAELPLDAGVDFESTLFLLFREALLNQTALYLRHVDRLLEPPAGAARFRALMRCVAEMGSTVFLSGEQAWSWPVPSEPVSLRIVAIEPDGFDAQFNVWRSLTGTALSDTEVHHLVSLHPLPVTGIRDAWRMAEALRPSRNGSSSPTMAELQQACRTVAGTPASTLARRIEARHAWSDLVLPAVQLEQLSAICSQARHSSIVYGAWRFEQKLSLGRGMNVMFSGPPGTGKTMAAEVIAAELGVHLLKIDLSQIVSKYIGETEKNLRQLFDQAVSANAILFFDEADALLGKRSDVKDAHDRYANTETAYLLQKMEEYPGITILATNLRQNMDAAFTRRMRFIVDFPFPEDDDRLRIWQSVWPHEVPMAEDVDLPLLARQFRLSGGSIRNVALSAAFLAAEQEQAVSMRHLMQATKRELQKMGRLINEEDHRRYG